jgi:hypothetical protein
VPPDLDALLTALYVSVDDLLPRRVGRGRRPLVNDAEIICLAVAQALLDCPSDRRFLALAGERLGHLFPRRPKQPGYNKRLRRLAGSLAVVIEAVAADSPGARDNLWLLDSTPVPCGQSRETTRRSQLAGYATYGYCRSHSRYFWGFRLHLLCSPDGTPIRFALTPANAPERDVAEDLLDGRLPPGQTIIADKGYAGRDFERFIADQRAVLLRPDRKDEPARLGNLGGVRQWIESIIAQLKHQLSLERHGGRTLAGVAARVCQRLLALATGVWHNHRVHHHPRSLVAYDH